MQLLSFQIGGDKVSALAVNIVVINFLHILEKIMLLIKLKIIYQIKMIRLMQEINP